MIDRLRARLGREPDERGFVMVMTALVIVVLMTMAAFAVDIGAWYSRATQIQRAADAAALAGVVFMPQNYPRAQEVALETAAKNGFVDPRPNIDGDTIDINIVPDPSIAQRLRVTITDRAVNAYFASMFIDHIQIARLAVAHYAEPLPLGSPENMLGIGPQKYVNPAAPCPGAAGQCNSLSQKLDAQNFYLAVNGRCAAAEEGDLLLSQWDGNALNGGGGGYSCNGVENPMYDPTGYVVDIEFPSTLITQYRVQIWDPAYNPQPNPDATQMTSKDYTLDGAGSYTHWDGTKWVWSQDGSTSDLDTTFRLTAPDTISPLDYSKDDIAIVPAQTYVSKDPTAPQGQWVDLATIGSGTPYTAPGKYRLTAFSDWGTHPDSWGVNVFAVRVVPFLPPGLLPWLASGGWVYERLSSINAGIYANYIPRVYGRDYLSIYANAAGSRSDMYLAQIAPVHAGKRIQLELWDPGEGGKTLQILDPSGAPVAFNWSADGVPAVAGQTNTSLNLGSPCLTAGSSSYSQPRGGIAGKCLLNDRLVTIEFDVPPEYTGTTNAGWWRIRYDFHAAPVTDRTTWRIAVEGDPVHLVDGDS